MLMIWRWKSSGLGGEGGGTLRSFSGGAAPY